MRAYVMYLRRNFYPLVTVNGTIHLVTFRRSSKSVRRRRGMDAQVVPTGRSRPELERAGVGVGGVEGVSCGARPGSVRADRRAGRARAAAQGPHASGEGHAST